MAEFLPDRSRNKHRVPAKELLSIRVSDVWDRETEHVPDEVTVTRRDMKGKVQSRSTRLNAACKAAIRRYMIEQPLPGRAFLFQSRQSAVLSREQVRRILIKTCKRCGVSTHRVGTHSLRKTFANRFYRASGRDLHATQRALNHRNVNTTIVYLDLHREHVENTIDRIGTLFFTE